MKLAPLAFVLVAGCGTGDPPFVEKQAPNASTATGAPAVPTAAVSPVAAPRTDWPKAKRTTHAFTLDGIAVTLDVPDGLPRDPKEPGDWFDPRPEFEQLPRVITSTIEVSRVRDLETARYHATLHARQKTWVRGDERADGWGLTAADPDGTAIEAITYRRAGELYVQCKATVKQDGKIADAAAMRTLLESICDSLQLK